MSEKIKVNVTGCGAVAKAFNDGYATAATTGSYIDGVLKTAGKYFGKGEIPEPDQNEILTQLCKLRGWKGGTADSRKSEVRAVLSVRAKLASAVSKFKAKNNGNASWHEVIRLARKLKNDTIEGAVSAMVQQAESTKPGKLSKQKVYAKLAAFTKACNKYNTRAMSQEFKNELRAVMVKHGVNV